MKLYEKKLLVKQQMNSISKDKRNDFVKYKYATLFAILEELTPLLNMHGLLCDIAVVRIETTPYMSEHIQKTVSKDNSTKESYLFQYWVRATLTLIEVETGEKEIREYDFLSDVQQANDIQKSGSTMTYAQRYALSAYFGLAFDEDDPDHTKNIPERVRNDYEQKQVAPVQTSSVNPNCIPQSKSSELFNLAKQSGYIEEKAQKELLSGFGLTSWLNMPIEKAKQLEEKLLSDFNFKPE